MTQMLPLLYQLYNDYISFICEGWHFTHMWKALPWTHHFTKRLGPQCNINVANFYHSVCIKPVKLAVIHARGVDFASFYDFLFGFWNC